MELTTQIVQQTPQSTNYFQFRQAVCADKHPELYVNMSRSSSTLYVISNRSIMSATTDIVRL